MSLNKFLNYIPCKNRNILSVPCCGKTKTYTIHACGYDDDEAGCLGIDFHELSVSIDELKSKSDSIEMDWIFNVQTQFIKFIDVGGFIICEIPDIEWAGHMNDIECNIFLYTGYKQCIWLQDREIYRIEYEGVIKYVWIGETCSINDILVNTCLNYIIEPEFKRDLITTELNDMPHYPVIYARSVVSMDLLDDLHRDYVMNCELNKGDIVAVKSVAGSGKTTTLLTLAKKHRDKKILYLAFNKSLINDINEKKILQKINNLVTKTFDALMYEAFWRRKKQMPQIVDLKPNNIGYYIDECKSMYYTQKEAYCKRLDGFCNDHAINDIKEYCMIKFKEPKPILEKIWSRVLNDELATHNTNRKQAYMNHWLKDIIDSDYDMIMVDETQDFDRIMLEIILQDTTIPKVFVGDPKQAIYQFRGCINAFDYLPQSTLVIEFYSTFRVGNPACQQIRDSYDDCWMISRSKNTTTFVSSMECQDRYVYLFRTWKNLLLAAESMPNIWIYNFENKIRSIRSLHSKVINSKKSIINMSSLEGEDLPKFLKTLSPEKLDSLLRNIETNLVPIEESKVQLYTTHSYKGLEAENIRISSEVSEGSNVHYVAITRGKSRIVLDIIDAK